MSLVGQTEKNSVRAYVFRIAPVRAAPPSGGRHPQTFTFPDLGGCVRDVGKYSHDYSNGPASYNRNRWRLQYARHDSRNAASVA
jgi:hypothetical protein